MEQLYYNLIFRGFLAISVDQSVWNASKFFMGLDPGARPDIRRSLFEVEGTHSTMRVDLNVVLWQWTRYRTRAECELLSSCVLYPNAAVYQGRQHDKVTS